MEELISLMKILMLWDQSSHDEVDDVCILGSVARDGKEILIKECIIDYSCTLNMEMR